MSETNLYKTVTLSQEQCLEVELAVLARIGQLRERIDNAKYMIERDESMSKTWRDIIKNSEADLVTAHQVLTTIAQGRLFA